MNNTAAIMICTTHTDVINAHLYMELYVWWGVCVGGVTVCQYDKEGLDFYYLMHASLCKVIELQLISPPPLKSWTWFHKMLDKFQ